MNICFDIMGNELWTAGHIYLSNLCNALSAAYPENVKLFLANRSGKPTPEVLLRNISAELISEPFADSPGNRPSAASQKSFTAKLQDHQIDVFFGSPYAVQPKSIPLLSLLIDFQHVRFPEFFSSEERSQRDAYFHDAFKLSNLALISGRHQEAELKSFTDVSLEKVRVYHPTSIIPDSIYESNPRQTAAKYQLPERFILLPNQFWKHKNHALVIDALAILKQEEKEVLIALTGNPHDYRFPTLFTELMSRVTEQNLETMFRYLGLIPYEDVLSLMRQSICVLNPSLYEGIGLSIEEAKALGKPALLSDIPAHREREAPEAVLFQTGNAKELSEKIWSLWKSAPSGPAASEEDARRHTPERIANNARTFYSICEEALT